MAKNLLGQNFLVNQEIARKIVEALGIERGDFVVEVGPGKGALTDFLAQKPLELLLSYEKDYKLVAHLRKKYHSRQNIKIAHQDILRLSQISNLKFQNHNLKLKTKNIKNYKLISNLPYSITSFFINKFFISGEIEKPEKAVLMMQKEVAERLTSKAGNKNRGVLSVLLQALWEMDFLFNVSRDNFNPAPKVDSAVIKFTPKFRNLADCEIGIESWGKMIWTVKAGFSAKRKKLANALSRKLAMPKSQIVDIINKSRIASDARAEDLEIADWIRLSENISVKI